MLIAEMSAGDGGCRRCGGRDVCRWLRAGVVVDCCGKGERKQSGSRIEDDHLMTLHPAHVRPGGRQKPAEFRRSLPSPRAHEPLLRDSGLHRPHETIHSVVPVTLKAVHAPWAAAVSLRNDCCWNCVVLGKSARRLTSHSAICKLPRIQTPYFEASVGFR